MTSKEEGVLVAADANQEWLLSWWWENYSRFNQYPVTFVDLGLTEQGRRWCDERGAWLAMPKCDLPIADKSQIDPGLVAEWEFFYGKTFWPKRPLFFLKPLICLQTPYEKTLWLDLDCEVRCCVSEVFAYLQNPGFCISQDLTLSSTQQKTIYNGGVIGFSKRHPLLIEWSKRVFDQNAFFFSDQELLSHLIVEGITVLPSLYQWSHYFGDNAIARIVHWHGELGKKAIKLAMRKNGFSEEGSEDQCSQKHGRAAEDHRHVGMAAEERARG